MISKIKSKYLSIPLPIRVAALYMLCSVIEKGIFLVVIPIYTRLVSSEQYGYYSLFQSWELVLIIFATLNLQNYLFSKGMIKYADRKDEFTSALIGLCWILTIGLFLIYLPFIDEFEKFSGLSFGLMCMMFIYFLFRPSYAFWCSRQRFEYNIKGYIITTILIAFLSSVLSVIAVIILKRLGFKKLGAILIAGKTLVPVAVYIVVAAKLLKKNSRLYEKDIWKYALGFNLPLIPHFLSSIILQQCDRIMIGNICGNSEAGVYSVAYMIGSGMSLINTAMLDSMIPWMYKKISKNNYDGIAAVGAGMLLLITAANICISLLSPEIIHIMAPKEYNEAMYVIPPVAISNVFICMFNLYANIEYYFEETKFVTAASVFSAAANIALNYICIKKFGFVAAGYTTVVCYILYALGHQIFMKIVLKKYCVSNKIYNSKLLWLIAIVSVIIAVSTIFLYNLPLIRFLLVLLIISVLLIYSNKIFSVIKELRNS